MPLNPVLQKLGSRGCGLGFTMELDPDPLDQTSRHIDKSRSKFVVSSPAGWYLCV